ncbi:HRDC domain-containing protein [Paenibacillus sp. UMB4589-SE434]|uniref:HRDC domain-containing protein n=1 Tax=Paenibacillus sp. UMB4589-SE434 TaxID=3046314 RepID=UPI002549D257|nr:HRDC domain-containing protein [Paenibacillus sp. UMB4589-SE434]MDK8183102.1 HRDC domain-containing protein [Paenibacillus sp. UMB4589-SE434]
MLVVWMTRMEKVTAAGVTITGLVSAGEEEGKWIVLWETGVSDQVDDITDNHIQQESVTWYEGGVWLEMRAALRSGMARLLSIGFQPALGFMPDTNIHERRMKEHNEWINCYGDLNVNDTLYERLTAWRREQAISLKRAPFWIATNRMLRLVSAFVPYSAEELRQLPGFGEAKVRAYAESITAITKTIGRAAEFPLNWVRETVSEPVFLKWVYEQEQAKLNNEFGKLVERRMLLEGIQNQMSAEQLTGHLKIDRRELLVRIEALVADGYDIHDFIELELSIISSEERQSIIAALAELGVEYLKPVFVRVYGEDALQMASGELQRKYEYIRLVRMTLNGQVTGNQDEVQELSINKAPNTPAEGTSSDKKQGRQTA